MNPEDTDVTPASPWNASGNQVGIEIPNTVVNSGPLPAASIPTTNPGSRPGLPIRPYIVYPASIGIISPIETPPISFTQPATTFSCPKLSPTSALPAIVSIRNANAMKIPPKITNGNMNETPFITAFQALDPKFSRVISPSPATLLSPPVDFIDDLITSVPVPLSASSITFLASLITTLVPVL